MSEPVNFSSFDSPESYRITITPRPTRLVFSAGGKEMLILCPDGTMKTGEGVAPDEATQDVARQLADHYAQEVTARIEELTRERDEAIRHRDTMFTSTADGITKLAGERDRLAAQVKEAVEVLRLVKVELEAEGCFTGHVDDFLARLETKQD